MNVVALCVCLLIIPGIARAQVSRSIQQSEPIHTLCRGTRTDIQKRRYKDYRIEIASAGDQSCQLLEIKKNGKLVYERAEVGTHFYFGDTLSEPSRAFQHLMGKGQPNLVVSEWTGGAHCCFLLHIFDLGKEFKKLGELGGGNYAPEFKDLDNDRIPELVVTDDILAEVFSCFADSAVGRVVLKYSNGEYRVASEHMKKPVPNVGTYKKKIIKWRMLLSGPRSPDWPPPPLVRGITDLYFSGNKEMARQLVDLAWPAEVMGKDVFLQEYEKTLLESELYREFEEAL